MGLWIAVLLSMGVSDMKKFLVNIALFFAIVAAVDFSLGKVFHYLQSRAGGRTGAEYYVCENATEDVIIMGSSRASHHYVPEIISEKMGMSCFNAGQDGNGIIMQYGRWMMLTNRYTPKVLIYDINSSFDMAMSDNMTYIDRLKPFKTKSFVKDYISSLFPLERLKMLSNMYCYNYKYMEMASDWIKQSNYTTLSGYIPLHGHIREEVVVRDVKKKKRLESDRIKIQYLGQIIKEARQMGVSVVLVVSPSWKGGYYSKEIYAEIESVALKYGALFLDYTDSIICYNPDYFKDSTHLNDKGARVFTEDLLLKIGI